MVAMLSGCAAPTPKALDGGEPADLAPPGTLQAGNPAERAQPAGPRWENTTVSGSFVGVGAPPLFGAAVPDSEVPTVDIVSGTLLLRLTLSEEPAGRADYYVAPPSCQDAEVSACRSEEGFDDTFTVFEAPGPEVGLWRFQVSGSGLGATEVDYEMAVDVLHGPRTASS